MRIINRRFYLGINIKVEIRQVNQIQKADLF
jgi:hypothetical protein